MTWRARFHWAVSLAIVAGYVVLVFYVLNRAEQAINPMQWDLQFAQEIEELSKQ